MAIHLTILASRKIKAPDDFVGQLKVHFSLHIIIQVQSPLLDTTIYIWHKYDKYLDTEIWGISDKLYYL